MTNEIAARAAIAVLNTIEKTQRINKADITAAIEAVLIDSQPTDAMWDMSDDAFRKMQRVLCGND